MGNVETGLGAGDGDDVAVADCLAHGLGIGNRGLGNITVLTTVE
jgi:hypothetical protein